MTQKSVSHTELQGPSCSLQKTRLQEQKNVYICMKNPHIYYMYVYLHAVYMHTVSKTTRHG